MSKTGGKAEGGGQQQQQRALVSPIATFPTKLELNRSKTRSGVPVVSDLMLFSDLLKAVEAEQVRHVRYASDRSGRVLVTLKVSTTRSFDCYWSRHLD